MKLTSVRVQNYKCIDDSGKYSVRDFTCLAGKNEAGKTALLQALRRLNPVEESEHKFDSTMEYPRKRKHEVERGNDKVLTTHWDLSDADMVAVEQSLGPGSITKPKVTVTRGYDNVQRWTIILYEKAVMNFLVSKTPDLTSNAEARIRKHKTIEALYRNLKSQGNGLTKGERKILERIAEFRDHSPSMEAIDILSERLPRFLYFPTYGTLPGKISAEEIARKAQSEEEQSEADRLFLALVALAGTNVEELRTAERYEILKATLESVSNRISAEIFEYWSQNRNLKVEFDYRAALPQDPPPFNEGYVFNLRVQNIRHGVTVGFDERSAGFVWFFSFLVWFSQMEELYGDRLIILLDEPGLSLHGKAQADLLRYIKEKLLTKYQVIYTTHSPFMIDIENILSVRTVEDAVAKDGKLLGTKVSGKVLSADADTLFPLRAALGYDLTQSLFIGEHSLLVEGPSDMLFLRWFSRQLTARDRIGLDPRWTVTPVGGIDKLGSFNALFAGNELHVAILTDFHSGDKKKVRELEESDLLEAGHLFSATHFVDQEEADVEDVVGRVLYADIVNRCYRLGEDKRLPVVRPDGAPLLVLEEVKSHFRTVATDSREFDHLSPAIYLVEHESTFSDADGLGVALERFERLFQSVNALLPPA